MAAKKQIAVPIEQRETLADAELLQSCEFATEKWFQMSKGLGLTSAATKEEFYGCRVSDIVDVPIRVVGFCEVVYFRLRDGRIIDLMARERSEGMLNGQKPTVH